MGGFRYLNASIVRSLALGKAIVSSRNSLSLSLCTTLLDGKEIVLCSQRKDTEFSKFSFAFIGAIQTVVM